MLQEALFDYNAWVHIQRRDNLKNEPDFMKYLSFGDCKDHLDLSKSRCLIIDHQYQDIEKFWDDFADGLGFPGYFGRNWNAFFDCLFYLRFDVCLIHETLPFANSMGDNILYLKCLADSFKEKRAEFSLTAIFRQSLRSQILAACDDAGS